MDLKAKFEELQGLASAGVREAEVTRSLSALISRLQMAAAEYLNETEWTNTAQAMLRPVERVAVRDRLEAAGFELQDLPNGAVRVQTPFSNVSATPAHTAKLRVLIQERDDRDAEQPDPVTSDFIIQTQRG